jgi:tetratricopeptide (TPR) repeat protein
VKRPEPAILELLRQGLKARRDGHLQQAQAAYLKVLGLQPEQPDALFLLGELAQAQGLLNDAENLLYRSVKSQSQQPQAWSRLGMVREDLGRHADAVVCYLRAAEQQPSLGEAHFNAARLLHPLGRLEQATQCLDSGLSSPGTSATLTAQMLQLRALMQEEAGQLDLALATLQQALQLCPSRAALHHNAGTVLQRLARPAQALAAHDTALALGLDVADAHYNRGNSLQSLGRLSQALQAYQTALRLDPQHALAMFDAARLRWRQGDPAFTTELDAAAAAAPLSAVPHGIKGRLMLRAERFSQAASAFGHAAVLDPKAAGYLDGQAQAMARLGQLEPALALHQQAIALAPEQAAPLISHAHTLLQGGQLALAAQQAQAALRLEPLNQQAWAMLGVAWRTAGDRRHAWLNDYDQHVRVFDLEPPPGWQDMDTFNRALAAALEPMHSDAEAPIDQTLRSGSQTLGDIFEQGHPLVMQLTACISQAVDQYIAHLQRLPADASHPLLGRTTQRWRFTDSWSSRLRGSGFHTPHVHPHGWISSVYYVAVPPSVSGSGSRAQSQWLEQSQLQDVGQSQSRAGWLTFGVPDLAVPGCQLGAKRAQQPQAGRLVLFPSYMWHATVPFKDTQPRLTVAFDVLPVG